MTLAVSRGWAQCRGLLLPRCGQALENDQLAVGLRRAPLYTGRFELLTKEAG